MKRSPQNTHAGSRIDQAPTTDHVPRTDQASSPTSSPRRGLASLRHAPSGKAIAIAGALIAIGVAPVALAAGSGSGSQERAHAASFGGRAVLRGGIHNPPHSSFSNTTGLFGNTTNWVMRTNNLGGGGAATMLCGTHTGVPACLEASNRSTGFAFQFSSSGSTGGTILLKNAAGAPFTTNAHGVASGLNANYLQGKQASEFQLASKPAANAEDSAKLGGKPASEYATMGQLLFARVGPEGAIVATRGATAVAKSGSTYTITFGSTDVSKCSYTASPLGVPGEGQIGVAPVTGNVSEVAVSLPVKDIGGFDVQVIC